MMRKIVKSVVPLIMPISKNLSGIHFPRITPCPIQKKFFSTQKQQGKTGNPQKQEQKQPKQRKLTDFSNKELLQLNTEQSLKLFHLNLKKLEEHKIKNQEEHKNLSDTLVEIERHIKESTVKEEQLVENLKLQEEELKRIQKRIEKEVEDSKDYGITKLAKELLEFADSIKRCKQLAEKLSQEKPNEADEYLKKMINLDKKLRELLKIYEIEEFDPINQHFDPNTSQSLLTIPTMPGCTKNHVATTMMTGYKIKSRLLRSAKVGIFV